ncbi:MAG: nucleotidyltransferase domain-containing protein [Oscillospiraceae bacterium]|nr:nucleotidyltransferase domain-containing protein [Oscillospiraceae bacterium]
MDRETALRNATAYANEVRKFFSPMSIVLYGSYAKGSPTPESDIDIAVIFNGYSGNWLNDSAKLWELTRRVSTHIEPVLLDHTNDPSGFVENIYNHGIMLHNL